MGYEATLTERECDLCSVIRSRITLAIKAYDRTWEKNERLTFRRHMRDAHGVDLQILW